MKYLPDNYYHIYNRGNDGHRIFLEPENYAFFLRRLRKYCDRPPAQLVAYALMPNHYHAIVLLDGTSDFSNVLRAFTTSYVRAFNTWHGRVGYLYQGNTKAKLIDSDEYLIHLCRYIHLNPVRAHLADCPEQWKYSDYREWISDSTPSKKRCVKVRSMNFESGPQYQAFVMDYAAEERMRAEIEGRLFDESR
ncbi:MAG: transposase [Ignavibacteriales bacterium]|nr:transposase [Ignavibacteriales bacterium]